MLGLYLHAMMARLIHWNMSLGPLKMTKNVTDHRNKTELHITFIQMTLQSSIRTNKNT